MIESKINLARKFRSKNFDQIIGQTLSVRMLKNSLYLGHYFPVYLFSGQRGCGKTTTARVFSSAINCKNLEYFQKNPKLHTIPCTTCNSCVAMITGTHPDFIEIDAASHTGVDNVRNIIDASSLLPLMGIKKIYLIDEAHMLSKAAFNAFLKILEEPPINTIFILATTDQEKIIDTVRSRCFQLLFRAVQEPVLLEHLQQVCAVEHIASEKEALSLIIHETDGSVRDSLNVIEQVRFAHGSVTKAAVLSVLNHLDTACYLQIVGFIVDKDTHGLLAFLKNIELDRFSADHIWHRFIELIRSLVWIKYGVNHDSGHDMDKGALKTLALQVDIVDVNRILSMIYKNEEIFLKTTAQHLFLEMFFIQLCLAPENVFDKNQDNNRSTANTKKDISQRASGHGLSNNSSQGSPKNSSQVTHDNLDRDLDSSLEQKEEIREKQEAIKDNTLAEYHKKWQTFLEQDAIKEEPLVYSVLSQGEFLRIELDNQLNNQLVKVLVQLPKRLSFFEAVINDARALWNPSFENIFSKGAYLCFVQEKEELLKPRDLEEEVVNRETKAIEQESKIKELQVTGQEKRVGQVVSQIVSQNKSETRKIQNIQTNTQAIDISDKLLWKKTHMVLQHFPGTVREIQ